MSVISVPLNRRKSRLAVSAVFFAYGLTFASWASRIPTIQQELNISDSGLGLVLFALPAGLFLCLPFSGWLINHFGSKRIVVISGIVYTLLLLVIGIAQNLFQLVSVLLAFGFFSNLLNIAVNTQAAGVEASYDRPVMASFHGMWSLAGFAGAAIGTLMMGFEISPGYHFVLIFALMVLIMTLNSGNLLTVDAGQTSDGLKFVMPDRSLLKLGVIAFCSLICEGTMFDWSGVYFLKIVKAEPAWVGAGYTAYMIAMASGRFIADWLTHKIGVQRVLQLSGFLTVTGLLISVFFPQELPSIIGFLIVGLGVSSVVPLAYSAASKSKTMPASQALSTVTTIGFLGLLVGPPIVGLIAGETDLRIAFIFLVLMGIMVFVLSSFGKFRDSANS
ncbi:MFS transporter [Daejeonella lutea]|uniref:Fucose permease n=1 Tax=Daejeonella lutea TaxID=572036 RepID=A0A1T5EJ75_9SPHI|nr:MFS transporter [Daejeonella lutea]SKB83966.1 Fucose permease [Daejeonella lutea]